MKRLLLILALIVHPASAQNTYRCENTYSDRPCAIGAKPMRMFAANVVQMPRAPRNTESEDGPRFMSIGEPHSNNSYCRGLLDKKADAEHWAGVFVHPDNIQRERNRAKNYDDRYFSDCYGS